MSEQVTEVNGTAAPAPVATPAAPKQTAIQIIEAELAGFLKQAEIAAKQAEQAVANSHAVQGAIQATQHLLLKLKSEAAKAEAEAKTLVGEAKAEGIKVVDAVVAKAKKL